jgi:hypothetical protein
MPGKYEYFESFHNAAMAWGAAVFKRLLKQTIRGITEPFHSEKYFI